MLAYIEAIQEFKRNKEVALAVLKNYPRNDDREALEHNYNGYREQVSVRADSGTGGDSYHLDGAFKHHAGGEKRRSGAIRLVQSGAASRSERLRQTAAREVRESRRSGMHSTLQQRTDFTV